MYVESGLFYLNDDVQNDCFFLIRFVYTFSLKYNNFIYLFCQIQNK